MSIILYDKDSQCPGKHVDSSVFSIYTVWEQVTNSRMAVSVLDTLSKPSTSVLCTRATPAVRMRGMHAYDL